LEPRPFSSLPAGSRVFLDANILIYAAGTSSRECQDLITKCAQRLLTGICLYETLNEVTHRMMLLEARAKGLIRSGQVKELREHRDLVPKLTDFWRETDKLLKQNLLFLPLSEELIRSAQRERQRFSLLTNDSMIVACMRRYGIEALATSDRDFERVGGISVYRPADL
jgi:predicted nucleic acid-binding protein